MQRQRLIRVSGSSAPHLAFATLTALHKHPEIETHLVVSARTTYPSAMEYVIPAMAGRLETISIDPDEAVIALRRILDTLSVR